MKTIRLTQSIPEMLPTVDAERLIQELRDHVAQEVLTPDEAATYLRISRARLYNFPKEVIPYHQIEGLKGRLYLRSEILATIKKS